MERQQKRKVRFQLKSITSKLILMFLATLVIVVTLSVYFVTNDNNAFADSVISGQIERAFANLKSDLAELQAACEEKIADYTSDSTLSANINNEKAVADAVEIIRRDFSGFITVTDATGTVIYSNDEFSSQGDDLSELSYIKQSLSGDQITGIHNDDERIFCGSAAAINFQNEVVGSVIVGYNYNQTAMLDKLKVIHGVDFTIFKGDIRWATTIIKDKERVVGTPLDPKVSDIVLKQKQDYTGSASILNQPYNTAYSPIIDANGNAVGIVFAGQPMAQINQHRSQVVFNTFAVSVGLLVLSALLVYLFVRTKIKKPLLKIKSGAEMLAEGKTDFDLDIKSNDEIGALAKSFRDVNDSINGLINDANMLSEAALHGNLNARSDTEKHKGDYRKIVEGINNTLDAVIAPITEAKGVLSAMSQGDLNVSVTGHFKGDHAIIKNALNETINSINGYIHEIADVLEKMSDGDMSTHIESDFEGDFVALKDAINHIVDSLNRILSEINIAVDQVFAGSRQVSDGSQVISQGATEQASSIEQLTASISSVAQQTSQNAANINKVNDLAHLVRENAASGNVQMQQMQKAMLEINDSSANISRIIKVIDEIAFQTNILALNAAVEAARAGEHGKGFAVVAEEVRNLAARSADAAKETTALIEGSVEKVEAGTTIADSTAKALDEIVSSVEETAALITQILSASNAQATALSEVNQGIEQISQVVQTNSAISEQTAAAAEELSSQAHMLKGMVERFKLSETGIVQL
jgi:methyl-accepting chemotaxis protein